MFAHASLRFRSFAGFIDARVNSICFWNEWNLFRPHSSATGKSERSDCCMSAVVIVDARKKYTTMNYTLSVSMALLLKYTFFIGRFIANRLRKWHDKSHRHRRRWWRRLKHWTIKWMEMKETKKLSKKTSCRHFILPTWKWHARRDSKEKPIEKAGQLCIMKHNICFLSLFWSHSPNGFHASR